MRADQRWWDCARSARRRFVMICPQLAIDVNAPASCKSSILLNALVLLAHFGTGCRIVEGTCRYVPVIVEATDHQHCVRTFMKRLVKLPVQFERSTSLSDTPPFSAVCTSIYRYGRDRVQRPGIVKRLSLARRGGSPFYARSVWKALFGAGA